MGQPRTVDRNKQQNSGPELRAFYYPDTEHDDEFNSDVDADINSHNSSSAKIIARMPSLDENRSGSRDTHSNYASPDFWTKITSFFSNGISSRVTERTQIRILWCVVLILASTLFWVSFRSGDSDKNIVKQTVTDPEDDSSFRSDTFTSTQSLGSSLQRARITEDVDSASLVLPSTTIDLAADDDFGYDSLTHANIASEAKQPGNSAHAQEMPAISAWDRDADMDIPEDDRQYGYMNANTPFAQNASQYNTSQNNASNGNPNNSYATFEQTDDASQFGTSANRNNNVANNGGQNSSQYAPEFGTDNSRYMNSGQRYGEDANRLINQTNQTGYGSEYQQNRNMQAQYNSQNLDSRYMSSPVTGAGLNANANSGYGNITNSAHSGATNNMGYGNANGVNPNAATSNMASAVNAGYSVESIRPSSYENSFNSSQYGVREQGTPGNSGTAGNPGSYGQYPSSGLPDQMYTAANFNDVPRYDGRAASNQNGPANVTNQHNYYPTSQPVSNNTYMQPTNTPNGVIPNTQPVNNQRYPSTNNQNGYSNSQQVNQANGYSAAGVNQPVGQQNNQPTDYRNRY
ncbi:MAG: hypothetical protein ACRC2T_13040 [Thermoguttaceae bacterium]